MRTCDIEISIHDAETGQWGAKVNLKMQYDFHLIKSPDIILAPFRKYEKQTFPESAAPEIDPRTVKLPFDYKISLGYWGTEEEANARIIAFYDSLFTVSQESDIVTAKYIELFNNYKNVKMRGYAKKWDEKKYTIPNENALILFDFTLDVNDPMTLTNWRPSDDV